MAVLLAAARGLAEVAGRLGQPPVVGEILAGVILGPSLLAGLWPGLGEVLIPDTATAGHLLELIGLLGAMLLLVVTGIETDIPLIRRHAGVAMAVAAGGLVLPFAGGLWVATLIPDHLLGDPSRRVVFTLFLATALSVSAIPVVAKVLLDLGLIRRTFGQTVLAAGMVDDTVAWVMLSVVLALGAEEARGPLGAVLSAGRVVVFLVLAATLGRKLVDSALAAVQDRGKIPERVLTMVMVTVFVFGATAQALGIEAVLGAFVAGIILGQNPRVPVDVVRKLQSMALAVFSPIFFAIAGLKVEVARLADPELLRVAVAVISVAVVGKVAGAYLGGRLVGVDRWTALAYGSALDARGAVGIIIASIGLELGILTIEIYSVVVLMAVLTSVITPPLVRAFLRRAPVDPVEQRRLEREAAESGGFGPPRRVLIPVRPRAEIAAVHRLEAEIVSRLAPGASITLLSVARREERRTAERLVDELGRLFDPRPTGRVAVADDPLAPILEAAAADHDLLILGAPERTPHHEFVFNELTDAVTRLAPCPTLIVTGNRLESRRWPPRRLLVPTDGTTASVRAAQIGFRLAGPEAEVIVLNVVTRTPYARVGSPGAAVDRRMAQAEGIVDDLVAMLASHDVAVRRSVRIAASVEETILLAASDEDVDLVVMGTALRPGSSRLHLGPQVEAVLHRAPCPVLILNAP